MAKGTKIEWAGVDELKANFERVGLALDDKDPQLKQIILKPAQAAVGVMQSLAPVRTGTLRDAIYATVGPRNQRGVYIGVKTRKAPYARFVEFGTSKMHAQRFFRPGMLQMATTYVQDIAPDVKTFVETTAAKNAYHPPR